MKNPTSYQTINPDLSLLIDSYVTVDRHITEISEKLEVLVAQKSRLAKRLSKQFGGEVNQQFLHYCEPLGGQPISFYIEGILGGGEENELTIMWTQLQPTTKKNVDPDLAPHLVDDETFETLSKMFDGSDENFFSSSPTK